MMYYTDLLTLFKKIVADVIWTYKVRKSVLNCDFLQKKKLQFNRKQIKISNFIEWSWKKAQISSKDLWWKTQNSSNYYKKMWISLKVPCKKCRFQERIVIGKHEFQFLTVYLQEKEKIKISVINIFNATACWVNLINNTDNNINTMLKSGGFFLYINDMVKIKFYLFLLLLNNCFIKTII